VGRPEIRLSRISPSPVTAGQVAAAVWQLAYGEADAELRRIDGPGAHAAAGFLVRLVLAVEDVVAKRSAASGPPVDSWAVAEYVADEVVPPEGTVRLGVCEQLGLHVPNDRIAGELLFALARDIADTLVESLLPILRATLSTTH
jgi:hypothetical protein